jgi:hypothetical protein
MTAGSTALLHTFLFVGAPVSSAIIAADMVDDGWAKLVAGGGAAALVAGLMVWVLRHVSASNERIAATFAESSRTQAEQFHETTTTLLREHRAESSAREDKLITVLREKR